MYVFIDTIYCDKSVKDNEFKKDVDFASKLENEYLSEIFTW